MSKLYYRLCRGLADTGQFYPVETSPYEVEPNLDQEIYKSVYFYTEEQVKEAEEEVEVIHKKTKKPYTRKRGIARLTLSDGTHLPEVEGTTNQLIFDFDDENEPNNARVDTIEMIQRLIDKGIDRSSIDVYYSGKKGFNLIIPTKQYFSPTELKGMCMVLKDGLPTGDSVVYNTSRILRLPYSQHNTKRYKTPLTHHELKTLNMEEIQNLASDPWEPEESNTESVEIPEKILAYQTLEVKNNLDKPKAEISGLPDNFDEVDFRNKPAYLSAAKYILELGYIPRGYGQEARMILAASYKKAGKNEKQCYHALKAVSDLRVEKYGPNAKFDKDEVWQNVIQTIYSDSWQGGTYPSDHPILFEIEERLPLYLKRTDRSTLLDNQSVMSKFRNFAVEIDKNTLKIGIPSFDEKVKLLAGTFVGIVGTAGCGKSTLAMNLLAHNSLKGEKSIFYSLDMAEPLVALKQVQRKNNLTNDQVFELAETEPEKFDKLLEKSRTDFENVMFSFRFGITPDDIRNDIMQYEEKTNDKVRLVVVDYLENVTSGYSDPVMGAGIAAQQLADVAAELGVLMVVLLQTQKTVREGEAITSYRCIKGSSVIEQCSSVICAIYREGQPLKYQPYDQTMSINVVKNRYGPCSSNIVGWSGARSLIMEMTDDQRHHLDELRRIKEEEAEEAEKNNRW